MNSVLYKHVQKEINFRMKEQMKNYFKGAGNGKNKD